LTLAATGSNVPFMYAVPTVPDDKRGIMREIALTYRRTYRQAKAEGCTPPQYQERAVTAAFAAYLRLDPDAPKDRLEASGIANQMIAVAISRDTDWFWRGPDA
jgi:hypothetical protein